MSLDENKYLTLEQEFEKYKFYHKYGIIEAALMVFADEGIYDSYLLRDKYDDITVTGDDKACEIVHRLADKHFDHADDKELDELYNYCYEMYAPLLNETDNFSEEV